MQLLIGVNGDPALAERIGLERTGLYACHSWRVRRHARQSNAGDVGLLRDQPFQDLRGYQSTDIIAFDLGQMTAEPLLADSIFNLQKNETGFLEHRIIHVETKGYQK